MKSWASFLRYPFLRGDLHEALLLRTHQSSLALRPLVRQAMRQQHRQRRFEHPAVAIAIAIAIAPVFVPLERHLLLLLLQHRSLWASCLLTVHLGHPSAAKEVVYLVPRQVHTVGDRLLVRDVD